tara:strand:+ start:89 stop:196 length:108 start_codon:yes stop_codon:yes gene_type:complete
LAKENAKEAKQLFFELYARQNLLKVIHQIIESFIQ